jgi:hypothetical protein
VITHYACRLCGVSSAVELLDVGEPRSDLEAKVSSGVKLSWATCPACGKRNHEGVVEQMRDERNLTIFTIVMMVGLSVGAFFKPWIVLGWLGVFVLLYINFLIKRPTKWLVLNLTTTLAMGVAAWVFPRFAFLVLAIPTALMLLKRRDPEERERPWKEAAANMRFFDTAERRP